MRKIDWTVWKPRAGYGAFAAVCFLLALRWTFPSEAMKERLILEAGTRGWQIDVAEVGAGGLLGVHARGVKLESGTGLAVPLDDVTVSLRILPLLVGRRSVSFDVALYDGRVTGTADLSGPARRIVAEARGIDLGAALPLRRASGLDVVGRLEGTAEVTVPSAAGERPTGRVDLSVKEAGLAGGQIPVPGMTSGLALPRIAFGELTAQVKLGDGRATFERLETKGGEAELQTEGLYFVVQPRMEFAPIFGKAKVKVAEAFWAKPATRTFRPLADAALASAKGSDGAWSFSVSGSVGHPRLLPAVAR